MLTAWNSESVFPRATFLISLKNIGVRVRGWDTAEVSTKRAGWSIYERSGFTFV